MGELYTRTKSFAVRIVRLFQALPKNDITAQVLGKQLLRSGTSVGAQYREANRSRSRAEFLSKVEACLQELEETQYWIELLIEANIVPKSRLQSLIDEANQLAAMLTASAKTSKKRISR